MKFRVAISCIIGLTMSGANAGQIGIGKVEEITNIIGSSKAFGIKMSSDATGVCAGQFIQIQESNFGGNLEAYKFAFSLANTALAANKRIRIHNYSNDDCNGATFIGLYKK
ncbi:DUF5992 family protein [Aliikangiella sp. IMCC44359]|uniref:DUF5992 family protein n=1 Tax=Aliikangiella sp. IMCC44359 TaxID=3459125 RepID=UPI00403AC407